jgi:hypothetical protein
MEFWNPLGMLGLITAFNFPLAVSGWNSAISLVCGNVQIWKGATTTSLVTIATTKMIQNVFKRHNLPGLLKFDFLCLSFFEKLILCFFFRCYFLNDLRFWCYDWRIAHK